MRGNIYIYTSTFKIISNVFHMKAYDSGLRDTPYIQQM